MLTHQKSNKTSSTTSLKTSLIQIVSFSAVKSTARAKATHILVFKMGGNAGVIMSSLTNRSWHKLNLSAVGHALETVVPFVVDPGG